MAKSWAVRGAQTVHNAPTWGAQLVSMLTARHSSEVPVLTTEGNGHSATEARIATGTTIYTTSTSVSFKMPH